MGTVDRKDVFLGNDLLGRTLGEYITLFHNDDMVRETTEWERLEISSRKLEIPREHFMQRWA